MVVCVDLVFVHFISALDGLVHALEINELVVVPRVSFLKRILVFLRCLANLFLHIAFWSVIQNVLLSRLPIRVEVHACLFKFHEVSQQFGLPLEFFFSGRFEVVECFLLFFHLVNGFFKELLVYWESFFVSSDLLVGDVVINVLEIYAIFLKDRHWLELRKLLELLVNISVCTSRKYFELSRINVMIIFGQIFEPSFQHHHPIHDEFHAVVVHKVLFG